MRTLCTLASISLLSLSALAWQDAAAQGRGRDTVCVYEHADFRGFEQCFDGGDSVRDLQDRRNKISSVRVRGGSQITLYEQPGFGGRQVTIDRDVNDLSQLPGWNDQADSIRVNGSGRGDGRPDWGQGDNDRTGRVCVYEHSGFQGRSQCWKEGDGIRDLNSIGWNDGVSSIRTQGSARIVIFEHSEFQGQSLVIDRDVGDLTRIGWNDRISSLRVGDDRRKERRRGWN